MTGVRYRTPSRTRVGDTGYTRYREQSSSPDRGVDQQRCRHTILSSNIIICYVI